MDSNKLHSFINQVIGDMGATMHSTLIVLGDKLGLYKAMAGAGPLTSSELAERTGTTERYVREWLNANAAGSASNYHPSRRLLSRKWTFRGRSTSRPHASAMSRKSLRPSALAKASAGTNTSPAYSAAPSVSSAPTTR